MVNVSFGRIVDYKKLLLCCQQKHNPYSSEAVIQCVCSDLPLDELEAGSPSSQHSMADLKKIWIMSGGVEHVSALHELWPQRVPLQRA